MQQFKGSQIDIYKPNVNISNEGDIRTATYNLIFSNVSCDLAELSGQEKLMMGINATQPMRRLFIEPAVLVAQNIPVAGLILGQFAPGGFSILQGLNRSFQVALVEADPLDEFYIIHTRQDDKRWAVRGPVNHWFNPHEFYEANIFLLRTPPREIN